MKWRAILLCITLISIATSIGNAESKGYPISCQQQLDELNTTPDNFYCECPILVEGRISTDARCSDNTITVSTDGIRAQTWCGSGRCYLRWWEKDGYRFYENGSVKDTTHPKPQRYVRIVYPDLRWLEGMAGLAGGVVLWLRRRR